MERLKKTVSRGNGRFFLLTIQIVLILVFFAGNASAGTIQLPKTGQTTKYADKDDGDLEMGVAWPSPRFTDNNNGTVTDNLTGLVWLKNANCFGAKTWTEALNAANTLVGNNTQCGLNDNSTAGQWRLPNVSELESLVHAGQTNSATWLNGQGFSNVQSDSYWSSTTLTYNTEDAWIVFMWDGNVSYNNKGNIYNYVWPVRSGQ